MPSSAVAQETCDNDYKVVARVCIQGAVRCDAEAQLICIEYGGHLGTTNDGRSTVQYVSDWWMFHMAQQKRGYLPHSFGPSPDGHSGLYPSTTSRRNVFVGYASCSGAYGV